MLVQSEILPASSKRGEVKTIFRNNFENIAPPCHPAMPATLTGQQPALISNIKAVGSLVPPPPPPSSSQEPS